MMKYVSVRAVVLCSCILMSCPPARPAVGKIKNDLDGDGTADKIVLDSAKFDQNGLLESKRVAITLSRTVKTAQGVIETSTGNLLVYQGINPNDLMVDFSNRSSRDAAELSYLVYRWDKQRQDFCLKASVDGVPANQLQDELLPRQMEVARYGGCASLDGRFPERPLSQREGAAMALRELSSTEKGAPIPEYLAFELASLAFEPIDQDGASTVTAINDAGYYQIASDPVRISFPRAGSILQFLYKKQNADTDPNIDVYSISPKEGTLTAQYVGEIEPEGGPPNIRSAFLKNVDGNGSQELLLLVSWEIRHPAIGTSGNYYYTYVYANKPNAEGHGFLRLTDIEEKIGSGLDGTLEGKKVTFPYKDARSIRALLDKK